LRNEVESVANALRWNVMGSLTSALAQAVTVLGGPQQVASAAFNYLGGYLPEVVNPTSQQLSLLFPESKGSPNKTSIIEVVEAETKPEIGTEDRN